MLTGRVAIILGGHTPVGIECADAFAAQGAKVALVSVHQSAAMERLLTSWPPSQMACWLCDIAQTSMAESCLRNIAEIWGMPTILVTALERYHGDHTGENSRALIFSHHFLKHMQNAGTAARLIAISPPLSHHADENETRHIFEMQQLTELLAARWAPYHVGINMIQPGGLEPAEKVIGGTSSDPRRRWATAHDIAWAATMLASPAAQSITGSIIRVDGGLSLVERLAH